MPLQFENIFPGIGMRGRKKKDQALIDNDPFLIEESTESGMS